LEIAYRLVFSHRVEIENTTLDDIGEIIELERKVLTPSRGLGIGDRARPQENIAELKNAVRIGRTVFAFFPEITAFDAANVQSQHRRVMWSIFLLRKPTDAGTG
jgi:hypothetical protein